jgi:PTS system mannose-specific IID component
MTARETPAPARRVELSRGDVQRAFWLWTFFSHANYNYERLQGTAFAQAMTPIIRRLYDSPEEIKAALKRHLVFFNTEPNVGGVIHGAVIAMEEQRANGADIDDDAINAAKSGLMGPLAGVGDTITQGTITPILLSIGIGLAAAGNVLGPILYFVLEVGIMTALAYFMWMQGYDRGREGVVATLRSGLLDRVILGAGVLGNLVLGALTAQFVIVNIGPTIVAGGNPFPVQGIIDDLMPGLLPLLFVLLTWWLLARRRISPIWLLVIYLAFAMVAAYPFFNLADPNACGASLLQPFAPCPPPEEAAALLVGG